MAAPGFEKMPLDSEDHFWLARSFRKIDFFAGLTLGQLELILPNIERRRYRDKASVIEPGDDPTAVYIVYRGMAVVKRRLWLLGRPQEVARMATGELFGEMAILDGRRHRARVEAEGALEVFAVQARHFRYVLERNPGLIDHFKAVVADRMLEERRLRERREA